MAEFAMMVGLSGSGKSQFAEKYGGTVFSSDVLRAELYGDENDQSHNNELFDVLHKRLIQALLDNENCVLDSTNLSRKHRAALLERLPKDTFKRCYIMATPLDKCVTNSLERERKVPPHVVVRQWHGFETPCGFEGFDAIDVVNYPSPSCSLDDYMKMMNNFSQDNSHHTLKLDEHCVRTAEYVSKHTDDYAVILAAQLHDIGKLWTKTFSNYKGEPTKEAHYYSHNNVGAYESLLIFDEDPLPLYVSQLICYHMLPYQLESEKAKDRWLKRMGKDFYDDIMLLHEADKASHLSPSQEAKGAI